MSKELDMTVHGWVAAKPFSSVSEQTGATFVSVPIIHTPRYRNAEGDWTSGVSVTLRAKAWGPLAANIAACVEKGMPVIAVGRLTVENWADDQGTQRQSNVLKLTSLGPDLNLGVAQFQRVTPAGPRPESVSYSLTSQQAVAVP